MASNMGTRGKGDNIHAFKILNVFILNHNPMGNVQWKDVMCKRKLFAESLSDAGWQIQGCKAEVSALTLHLAHRSRC